MKITSTGDYRTRKGRTVHIYRIDNGKAHGRIPGFYDTTWWYVSNAEHAMCMIDDIVSGPIKQEKRDDPD